MNTVTKKIMIYSMVGLMQVGFGASVIEASPLYNGDSQKIVQLDNRHHNYARQREHDERLRRENARHEREMRRRHYESEREWHYRMARERERHDRALHDIAAFLIGFAIGSSNH